MTKKSTEVAEATSTEVGEALDYGEMAGMGFEDIDKSSLTIPVLKLLQNNSPEVEAEQDGARAGRTLNTVTGEFLDIFIFQPCVEVHLWQEWVPRTSGGGLVNSYDEDHDLIRGVLERNGGNRIPPKGQDGKRIPFTTPDGNELVETYYVYGQVLAEDGVSVEGFGVLPFSSTKVSVRSRWMTSMMMVKGKPPLFAHRALFTPFGDKNNAGQNFKNYKITPPFGEPDPTWAKSLIPPDNKELLESGMELAKMVKGGEVEVKGQDEAPSKTAAATEGEDIPF